MKRLKNGVKIRNWISKILFVVGFLLLSYPLVEGFNQRQYHRDAVATYQSSVDDISKEDIKKELKKSNEYNSILFQTQGYVINDSNTDMLSDKSYNSLLNQSDKGIMGSIEIPKIDVDLPIYHGTSEEVLSIGVGHQQGSSLPVGGENTRCILSGHRGLPSSKLFTRLDEMKEGDLFFLKVMNETLAYKVSKVEVVEPNDISVFEIPAGKDECSLVTCTPYGLNTQRLIVTGERVPFEKSEYQSIEKGFPSLRESIFPSLPIAILAVVVILKVIEWRKSKNESENIKE